MTTIKTSPPPNPLPATWLRAIANSITITFREHGWQKHEKRRVHHPTGNPRSNPRPTSSVHRSALLTNTETLETIFFLTGTVEPIPTLGIPPIAWELDQLTAAGALHNQPDLTTALNTLCRKGRRDTPFATRRNRHGNLTLRAGVYTTLAEREAITLVAAVATLHVLNEADYWDALAENDQLDAQTVLQLFEA